MFLLLSNLILKTLNHSNYIKKVFFLFYNINFGSMKHILRAIKSGFAHQAKFCIIGGGTAGVNMAAHLLRSRVKARDISIFQPSPYHYYQPGWTMVGSGMTLVQTTRQPIQNVVPANVHIVRQYVQKIDPQNKIIKTDKNHQFNYEHVIIAAGFKLDWDKIKNARQLLQDPLSKVCSIYDYKYSQKTGRLGHRFTGGRAIFTQPLQPIKCAGAPNKICFLLQKKWKKLRPLFMNVEFIKAQKVMFPVPKYSEALQKLAKQNKIGLTFNYNLVQITDKQAIFENLDTKQIIKKPYDFLHIVPPMSPPQFIKNSGLADKQGYVDVDKQTLQHVKYPNVWSLGDCSSLPTSKTAAAVFSQSQTLLKNLIAYQNNPKIKQFPQKYDGYSSCPIFIGDNKVMLAEFLYDHKVSQSFYNNQQIPRRSFYYLTKYVFPIVYWKLMPRGLWKGKDGIRWF